MSTDYNNRITKRIYSDAYMTTLARNELKYQTQLLIETISFL